MIKRIDRYEIIEVLGEGGQGTVYKALDTRLDNRIVALKCIHAPRSEPESRTGRQVLERFRREKEITSKLNYSQIAQVFDYGYDEENEVDWMARQYLDEQLLKIIREKGPFDNERGVKVIISIAEALDYIHGQNIIHRDIKPSNIFIQGNNAVLIDFGLAFITGETEQLSRSGQTLGTLSYIPPEVLNEATRARYQQSPLRDWWGLGCVAFEIYSGHRLYEQDESALIIAAVIQGEEQGKIDRELSSHPSYSVVKGLLERDPEKRLNSSDAIRNLLALAKEEKKDEKPVADSPVSVSEIRHPTDEPIIKRKRILSTKWEQRLIIFFVLFILLEMIFLIGKLGGWWSLPSKQATKTAHSNTQTKNGFIRSIKGHSYPVGALAYSPDGTILASGDDHGTIKLWLMNNGEEIRQFTDHKYDIISLKFSNDGTSLFSGSFANGRIFVYWVATGETLYSFAESAPEVTAMDFSPIGAPIAQVAEAVNNDIYIYDLTMEKRDLRHVLKGHTSRIDSVDFSPNGVMLASACYDDTVKLWSLTTKHEIWTINLLGKEYDDQTWMRNNPHCIKFSPDGKTFAAGVFDNVYIWSVDTGTRVKTLGGHNSYVSPIEFSPDGQMLASVSSDRITVWSVENSKILFSFSAYSPQSIIFSPDSKTLSAGCTDRTIKLFSIK